MSGGRAGGPPPEDVITPRRALLSVSDKTGLVELARGLAARGVALVSTGGTARTLREAGLAVEDVATVTGHPEVLGGRVKTLHPKIHGGILARRAEDLEGLGIAPFELVVVNLYRFEEAAARGLPEPDLVEEIDIGGPAMLRAAAKTFERVAVVCDPADYPAVLAELEATGGLGLALRRRLALAAFARTAAYDQAIVAALGPLLAPPAPEAGAAGEGQAPLPARLALALDRQGAPLRYGENPHQRGALYRAPGAGGLGALRLRGEGKELSFNNLLDLDAALALAHALPAPAGGAAACVIKHASPCGAAAGRTLAHALEAAWAGDPVSAFGSVIGCSRPLDRAAAEALVEKGFVEVVVAPGFDEDALACLRERKGWGATVRLVEAAPEARPGLELRGLAGAYLLQDRDPGGPPARWEVVTRRAPTPDEAAGLRFAWASVRFVRSNAIALARADGELGALVGVGGGQPSRVDAVELACRKAGERARGAALASDAFFPFPGGVEAAAAAGVSAVVQPGGSKKDAAVVAAADALGLAMVFTGTRHFRH